MLLFSEFLKEEQSQGVISASGKDAQRHLKKYIEPHVGSGSYTHKLAKDSGSISAGSSVKIHGHEQINGKTHVHVEDEKGNKETVISSKLHKPNTKTENKGHKFENDFIEHLKKHGLMDKDAKGAGSSAGTDFHVINKAKDTKHSGTVTTSAKLNGETKQDHTAAMGQLTIHHSKEKGWHISDEARQKRPEYAKHVEEHILPHMNKHVPDPSKQRKTESGRAESIRIPHPNMEPGHAYLKDHHVDLLHVGGKGTYAVGKDKTGHGLPNVSGKGLWTVRDKSKTPNARTVMFQPHGAHGLKPSHVNLEDEEHLNKFKKTLGH